MVFIVVCSSPMEFSTYCRLYSSNPMRVFYYCTASTSSTLSNCPTMSLWRINPIYFQARSMSSFFSALSSFFSALGSLGNTAKKLKIRGTQYHEIRAPATGRYFANISKV